MLKASLIIAAVLLEGLSTGQDVPLVETKSGMVEGLHAKTRGGRAIFQFLGIPYAKPATGSLRFKSPQKADPWEGVLSAQKECSACIQQPYLAEATRTTVTGSENCLCLNVFTPAQTCCNYTANLPVIVFIHGGAYGTGSSAINTYGPDLLLEKHVILATMNYRLGVMGFLCTADEVIPGNFGMKDQVVALTWVKENIASFGGNPDSITLFGQSSGASSVGFHQYSHLSQDLFHKAIAHSASILSPWAFSEPEVLKGRTEAVADMVGCPKSPSTALLECMQNVPAEKIVNTTYTFLLWDIDPITIWTPTIERVEVKDAFLTEDPKKSSQPLTKPLLTGYNNAEGGPKAISMNFGDVEGKFRYWNENFNTITPISLIFNNTALDRVENTVAIRQFYFGSENSPITPDMLKQITELYGDDWFSLAVVATAEKQQGKCYLYFYNYNKTVTICPAILQTTPPLNVGACHFDELLSLFPMLGYSPKVDPTNTDPDYLLSLKMVEMWTNFAKTSNPSTSDVTWLPIQSSLLEHLEISNQGMRMTDSPLKLRRPFWNNLGAFSINYFYK